MTPRQAELAKPDSKDMAVVPLESYDQIHDLISWFESRREMREACLLVFGFCTGLRISDLLNLDAINPCLSARNKGGVLRDMTELADSTGKVYDKDALFQGLTEREEAASTAVGGGAAFLHVKFHDEYLVSESFLALGRTARPVFFGAPDDGGTDIFFLINCTDRSLHLHVLARLCLLAHGTTLLPDLRAAPDAETMLEMLKTAETGLLGSLRR